MDKMQKTKRRRSTTISMIRNHRDDSSSKINKKIGDVKDIYALM